MSLAETPISKTKILLPKRRADLLTRKRLLDALYEFLDRKLIIVSAPAGYGKTSLLIDLAHHSDLPFCWLSLDPLDREPQRFIAYFIAALTERFPQFGNRSRSMLNTMTNLEKQMEPLLVTLVNEIYDNIHEHFVVVVDDFHLLDEVQAIQYFVNRFAQLVGENCHLILSSRSLPDLQDLTLLVAREQVGGLDFSDLTFRPDEIQALLAQNQQIHLSDADAKKLVEATEGWITGLQFTDKNQLHRGSNFHPPHGVGVSVFDYLGEQVLEQQPESLQLFLLRSSLLEEFDSKLCDAVLAPFYHEQQNWSKLIDLIIQKNLFALPVDANGQWIRYHHLFRDYLQERMRSERPDEVFPIQQRLAEYQEKQRQWERAYQLYKQLGDMDALTDMIERAGIFMYQNAMLTLESWLKDLPPSIVQRRPGLLSLQGAVETAKGNAAEAVALFDRAMVKFREQQNIPGIALTLARRGMTYKILGNYKAAVQDAEEIIQLTQFRDDLQWNYAEALRIKGLSLFREGQTLQASDYLDRALDIYNRVDDTHSIPILLMETAMINTAGGRYKEAKTSYEKALSIWKKAGNLAWQASLLNNLGYLYHQLGEYEQAVHALEEGLVCARQTGNKHIEALIVISLGDLYAEVEDFELAAQNYHQAQELTQQFDEQFLNNYLALAKANLAVLREDILDARAILDSANREIKTSGSNYELGLFKLIMGRLLLLESKSLEAVKELLHAKDYFVKDGRETETVWSRIWLAAAQCQSQNLAAAREELNIVLRDTKQMNHFTVTAAWQAKKWMKDLRDDPELKTFLRPLFEKVDQFEFRLPRVRRQLRRIASTIEVPPSQLVIRSFGQGQVSINGRPLTISDWQTQSVRELFFYFLAQDRPVTKERISETLWPDIDEPAKLKLRFKNEIYRLRRAVGQETILFRDDRYQFNFAVDHEYDVEAFEAYLGRARSSVAVEEQIDFYRRAIELVHGHYLEDIDATWVWPERERLSQLFLSAALSLAELYVKSAQMPRALELCQRALEYDATFEAAYRLKMQIYHRLGDRASIVYTFRACEEALKKAFDMPPSEETLKLQRELLT
jgi:LuxR family maltose regulon positive regulatory protein